MGHSFLYDYQIWETIFHMFKTFWMTVDQIPRKYIWKPDVTDCWLDLIYIALYNCIHSLTLVIPGLLFSECVITTNYRNMFNYYCILTVVITHDYMILKIMTPNFQFELDIHKILCKSPPILWYAFSHSLRPTAEKFRHGSAKSVPNVKTALPPAS